MYNYNMLGGFVMGDIFGGNSMLAGTVAYLRAKEEEEVRRERELLEQQIEKLAKDINDLKEARAKEDKPRE